MAKKIGTKALDLSSKGKSLIVKVTEKAGFHNYGETMFDDSEDLGLSAAKIQEILNSVHDLNEFIPEVKSADDIRKLLDIHWFGNSASSDDELNEDEVPTIIKGKSRSKVEDDEIDLTSGKDELDALLED